MNEYAGNLNASDMRFGIVVSRFNELMTRALLQGAMDCLKRHGSKEDSLTVAWVPGAFEIPLAAKKLADSHQFDAVICLGVVIRGETPHFDYVAGQAAGGILKASMESGVPVAFGVLTTENMEQAWARSGSKAGNKGYEAAEAAIEMVDLLRQLPREFSSNAFNDYCMVPK